MLEIEVTSASTQELEHDKRIRLQVLEGNIESKLKSMKDAWDAILESLVEIDTKGLWRIGGYESFQAYWKGRFSRTILKEHFDDSSTNYNNRRIRAIESAAEIVPMGTEYLPKNERQARPLTELNSAEEKKKAAQIAHDRAGGDPVTQDFEVAVQAVQSPDHIYTPGDRAIICSKSHERCNQAVEIIAVGIGESGQLVSAKYEDGRVGIFVEQEGVELMPVTTETITVAPVEESSTPPKPKNLEILTAQLQILEARMHEYEDRVKVLIEAIAHKDWKEIELLTSSLAEWMGL